MALITTIEVAITTGNDGTNSPVYLGLGGREFRLNRPGRNDFKRNDISQFVLGDASHAFAVASPADNDPKSPLPLDTADLAGFPIYLRLGGAAGHWVVVAGTIKVNAGIATLTIDVLPPSTSLRLGPDAGEVLYIRMPGC